MNKKSVTITITVIVIAICVCLAIILFGNKEEEKTNYDNEEINVEENESVENSENKDKEGKEEVTKIALDSKIGSELLNKLVVPNIYSKAMYKELDKNGISNDFKIMYAFASMTTLQEYSNYLREGEDYIGSYITSEDLEKVTNTIFKNTEKLKHKAVFEDDTYNEETSNYVIVARGFFGDSLEYVVEIPYEINEYEDKIEINSYRMYITREYEDSEETSLAQLDKVYYNEEKTLLATTIENENMSDELGAQKDILNKEIEDGSIKKENLEKTTWIFEKSGGKYLISDYTK